MKTKQGALSRLIHGLLTSTLMLSLLYAVPKVASAAPEGRPHEINTSAAFYTGDLLRKSIQGSFSYIYHLTPKYWIGTNFIGGSLEIEEPNGVGLEAGDSFFAVDAAFYFSLAAMIGLDMQGKGGIGADLYAALGIGNLWLGGNDEIYGFIGGGMIIYSPWQWLALRFELKDIMYKLNNATGGDFHSDISFNLGPSLFF